MQRQGTHCIHGGIDGELMPAILLVEPRDALLVADPEAAGGVELEVHRMLVQLAAWGSGGISRQLYPLERERARAAVDPEQRQLAAHPEPTLAVLKDLPILIRRWQRI